MFEKNLTDLVRGIRNNKGNEQKFINQCITEIKEELKGTNAVLKSQALQKLCYLKMLGFDISFAHFNAIEVMSSARFSHKRMGYLTSILCYQPTTEFVMLTTNLFKKEFQSTNHYEIGLALTAIATYCNYDLAVDVVSDIVGLLNHSKPYIRKKACLSLYKIFLQYPDALRPAFPRLKEKLEDSETSVISCAVNVICELARKNPKNYLALAPVLFKILTTSSNNWMLIKVIKLLGALTPLEPRLGKKLIEPLTNLMNTTSAMSLLYECINTCTIGLHQHLPIIRLCVEKLRIFIEDPDQNLKYLGLVGMSNVMKHHPKLISEYAEHVLQCLEDDDITIRMRAMELLIGMATKKNLQEIVSRVIHYMSLADDQYKDELILKIIELCSSGNYQYISSFPWYLQLLVDLTFVNTTKHGRLVADQILDVMIRVKAVQPFGVKLMSSLLTENRFFDNIRGDRGNARDVLVAAAWVIGEFSHHVDKPLEVLHTLLHPRVLRLPGHIQASYVNTALKVVVKQLNTSSSSSHAVIFDTEDSQQSSSKPSAQLTGTSKEAFTALVHALDTRIIPFTKSPHAEVQERACLTKKLSELLMSFNGNEFASEIAYAFNEELNPVAPKAQSKVPVPEGLDLDKWINEPTAESDDEDQEKEEADDSDAQSDDDFGVATPTSSASSTVTGKGSQSLQAKKSQSRVNDPFYIKSSPKTDSISLEDSIGRLSIDESREQKGATNTRSQSLSAAALALGLKELESEVQKKGKKGKKGRKDGKSDEILVSTTFDMPEGVSLSDKEEEKETEEKVNTFDIDLTTPLGANEVLPTIKAYGFQTAESSKKSAKVAANNAPEDAPKKKKNKEEKVVEKTKKTKKEKEASTTKEAKASDKAAAKKVDLITDLLTPSASSPSKPSSKLPSKATPTNTDWDSLFGASSTAPTKPRSRGNTGGMDDLLMSLDPYYTSKSPAKPSTTSAASASSRKFSNSDDLLSAFGAPTPVAPIPSEPVKVKKDKKAKSAEKEVRCAVISTLLSLNSNHIRQTLLAMGIIILLLLFFHIWKIQPES
eukprot:TRINITY_DN9155_c0_g1_i11.p1 TRINITY_DN9155_c0_g1~~TRINITY_DN9155_c0_g1_i11.p1  ORF type:complete len:1049 (+),score=253.74 TRINITY_DN9155_c0_g1_i11:115-3261(+)